MPDLSVHRLILGGDLNCWLNLQLDRSSSNICPPSKASKVIHLFLEEFAVSDAWCFFNPSKREYSFFSPVHRTYTRIDYFLVDNRLLSSVSDCKYNAIVLSDHAPLSVYIFFNNSISSRPPWCLNTRLLSKEDFVSFISGQIDFFSLNTNKSPDISAGVLWETFKAYIGGEIISYSRHESKLSILAQRISQLDNLYASSQSPDTYKERLSLQVEFDILMTHHTTELLLRTRSQFYEHGDKASKLLGHQLRQRSTSRQIPQIRTNSDKFRY